MKKLICMFLLLQGLTELGAQQTRNTQSGKVMVPVAVERKFLIEFPEAVPVWKGNGEVFTAQFINPLNNYGYIIVYDKSGNVIRREKELESQEYPASIHEYLNTRYPGEGFAVWSSTDSSGNQSFYSNRNAEVIRFDREGRILQPENRTRKLYQGFPAAGPR